MTQREALETGRFGGFAEALHKAAESGDVHDLVEAYARADDGNQAKLEAVFPGLREIALTVYNKWPGRRGWRQALAAQFPRLRPGLDEEAVWEAEE